MGLRLTNAADYAVRAMIHIACLPEGAVALRGDVARAYGIPSSFMAKILRQLVRAGLLQSSRGVHGGFALARPASEINLLEVVEAIEGPLALTDCMPEGTGCEWSDECPANLVWQQVQVAMGDTLRRATLEALVSAPRRNRKVLYVIDPHAAQAQEAQEA
jgi:Rrf2 family iron-sulfur cluster assembly transcriptional regulator